MNNDSSRELGAVGFEISPAPGWSVTERQSDGSEQKPAITTWSLMLAGQGAGQQRLGIFISLDTATLFNQREWQMALEQEISKVRYRAAKLLLSYRKTANSANSR